MLTVCEKNKCAGCMACVDLCPRKAITVVDKLEYMNAVINTELCVECGVCYNVCQQNKSAELRKPQSWLQGWGNESTRATSSSGGLGQELMRTMLRAGGVVAACRLYDGEFKFELIEKESEINRFIGSKYVKSNPTGIYHKIKDKLKENRKVLFIGLPCQVSSLRNYVKDDNNLYAVDLICHGSPTVKLLQKAIKEYGYDLSKVKSIYFRHSDRFAIETQPVQLVPKGVQDRYTLAFLKGLCYTENCYSCHYAQTNRVGDLTIGDSWGTEMTEELSKGVSFVMCQTEKGKFLLDLLEFNFFDVDFNNSVQKNKQLQSPSPMPNGRKQFFADLNAGKKFKSAVRKAYPKECIKQDIKSLLIKLHMYSGGGQMSNIVYEVNIEL